MRNRMPFRPSAFKTKSLWEIASGTASGNPCKTLYAPFAPLSGKVRCSAGCPSGRSGLYRAKHHGKWPGKAGAAGRLGRAQCACAHLPDWRKGGGRAVTADRLVSSAAAQAFREGGCCWTRGFSRRALMALIDGLPAPKWRTRSGHWLCIRQSAGSRPGCACWGRACAGGAWRWRASSTPGRCRPARCQVTAERLRPRLAICLEGTPADDIFAPAGEAQGVLGAGVRMAAGTATSRLC